MPTKDAKNKDTAKTIKAVREAVVRAVEHANELFDKYGDEEHELQGEALETVGKLYIKLRELENAAEED